MPRAHISPYAISYTLWYIALTVLVALIFSLLQWPGGLGTILLIAFGASWHAGRKFARHLGRAPSTAEGRAYSWRALLGCFLTTTALSFLVAWLAFGLAPLQAALANFLSLDYVAVGLGVMLLLGGLFYAAIRLGFAWAGARYAAED
ncbi:MAG: ABZJ_00895 family protein [Brachymonas sp.]|jgi:hypothetical protein